MHDQRSGFKVVIDAWPREVRLTVHLSPV